jgi:hypothetical protein
MEPSDQAAFRELAKMGLTIFRGLKEDGATDSEAMLVLTAMLAGMLQTGMQNENSE